MSGGVQGGREPSMKRGCMTGMVILLLLILGLMYMVMRVIGRYTPPEELRPYAYRESFEALLTSNSLPPNESRPLDSADLIFYLGAVDTIWNAWSEFERIYDSARAEADPDESFSPMDLDEAGIAHIRFPLHARRGLVDHFNSADRSWAEYLIIKKRVVAASGIGYPEVEDSLLSLMQRFNIEVVDEEERSQTGGDSTRAFFAEVERIRAGGIDSIERARVAPYRELLLTRGLPGLIRMEEMFYGEE